MGTVLPESTPGVVRRHIEHWEATQGNLTFRFRGLSDIIAPVGAEMAAVYVALRERFPAVRPDYIDVCADLHGDILGVTYTYGELLPTMRNLATSPGLSPSAAATMAKVPAREISASQGVRDVTATGCIEITSRFSTHRGYADIAAKAASNEVLRVLRGRPPQPAIEVSLPSWVLVHEFGHLTEAALAEKGIGAIEQAFAELSHAVLGTTSPLPHQWRYNLVNYPELPGSLAGRNRGGPARQHANRQALCHPIGSVLGRYATANRDELFAEAFSLALVGRPELRARLSAFLGTVASLLAKP